MDDFLSRSRGPDLANDLPKKASRPQLSNLGAAQAAESRLSLPNATKMSNTRLPSVIKTASQRPSNSQLAAGIGNQAKAIFQDVSPKDGISHKSGNVYDGGTSSNVPYYLSNLNHSNQTSQRDQKGVPPPPQQQESQMNQARLEDYFLNMQREQVGATTNGHQHSSNNNPRLVNMNRSNSQAVRGTKGRGIVTNLTNSTQQFNNSQAKQSNSSLNNQKNLQSNHTGNQRVQAYLGQSNNDLPYPANQGNSSMNNMALIHRNSQTQETEQNNLRTPFKQAKSRPNRNRTTENQHSRVHHQQLQHAAGGASNNDYSTPAVGRLYGQNSIANGGLEPLSTESGLRSLSQQQRNIVQQRLQPINLTNKIASVANTNQESIHSGQFIIERECQGSVTEVEKVANQRKPGLQADPYRQQNQIQGRQASKKSSLPQPTATGFKASNQNKIPLLKKESSGRSSRAKKVTKQQATDESKTKVDETLLNDELLVTFFDKGFGQKRHSQAESSMRSQFDVSEGNEPREYQAADIVVVKNDKATSNQIENGVRIKKQSQGLRQIKGDDRFNNSTKNASSLMQVQHKSQKNLITAEKSNKQRNFSIGSESANWQNLNSSLIVQSSNQQVDIKNLHPQGLYLGGVKQRKQKTTNSSHKNNFVSSAQEIASHEVQSVLNLSQGSDLNGGTDDSQGHELISASNREIAMNRSMLVQEYDLSKDQRAGNDRSTGTQNTAMSGGEESERQSAHSINNLPKFNYFKDSTGQSHKPQVSNQSVDTSPMTKTYNLRTGQSGFKSKVSMKSFLLNKKNNNKPKFVTPAAPVSAQVSDPDRASQRAMVESTNAYIRAAQENDRMSYLQSAGTINGSYPRGNGLSESDINGANSRHDFIASSSIPYRVNMANSLQQMQHQSQQHLVQPLPASDLAVSSGNLQSNPSGGLLLPLTQTTPYNLQQQQRSVEPISQQRGLDPDMTLFQLRQEIQRVPHTGQHNFDIKSRQTDLSMPHLPSVQPAPGRHPKQVRPQMIGQPTTNPMHPSNAAMNSSYQTIQREETQGSLALGAAAKEHASFMFSADKTRIDLQSQPSLYNPTMGNLDTSFASQNQMSANMMTIGAESSEIAKRSKKLNSNNGTRLDQNPFQKGPKLHLFKKSRRLKTSSAARQASDEENIDSVAENQIDQQTITTGIGQAPLQLALMQKQMNYGVGGLETSNTTLMTASQLSNVYGTIEAKPLKDKNLALKKQHSILGSAPKESKARPFHAGLRINQNSEEKPQQIDRAGAIASAASPYLALNKMRNESDEKLRPHTSEMYQTSSSINDIYGDDERDFHKEKTNQLDEFSLKQSHSSKGSRSRLQIADSRQSRTSHLSHSSSLNHDHNNTAKFNIVPDSSVVMNGSRHSFYGTQVVPNTDLGPENKKSRLSKKAIILSKGSIKSSKNGSQQRKKDQNVADQPPKASQPQNQQQINKIPLYKKLAVDGANQRNNAPDMNQTFNVPISQISNKEVAGARNGNNKIIDLTQAAQAHYDMAQTRQGFGNKNKEQSSRRTSPGSIYQSRHQRASDNESHERMTRNDSAQTPFFIPTPQRTDSNWGGAESQYQNQGSNSLCTQKQQMQLKEAIQNVNSTDHIRAGLYQAAAYANNNNNNSGAQKRTNVNTQSQEYLNIKIDNRISKKKAIEKQPESVEGQQTSEPAFTVTKMSDREMSQQRLEEALQQQASLDGQRKNLQSQNKAYRQPTRSGTRGQRQVYQQPQPIQNMLPRSIL